MASSYPSGLDSFSTTKVNATTTPTDHPNHHNDLADAINKVEAEIGVHAGTHMVRVGRSSTFSVANSTATTVDFNSETYDTNSYHDNATNPSRLTVPSGLGGLYYIEAATSWVAVNVSGFYATLAIDHSVAGVIATDRRLWAATVNFETHGRASTVYNIAATEFVTVSVFQNTGASRNLNTETSFYMVRLGPNAS